MQLNLFQTEPGKAFIVLPGRPITKKNNMQAIPRKNGKGVILLPSKAYRDYEKQCLRWLMNYKGPRFHGPVHVKALYWMPDKRSRPDLVNLEEATADILEAAKVIDNDRYIESWDGSRIIGVDKGNPRVEITIMEM